MIFGAKFGLYHHGRARPGHLHTISRCVDGRYGAGHKGQGEYRDLPVRCPNASGNPLQL